MLYRAANLHAIIGKNKDLLHHWQSNKKAWVMAALFLDCFHQCSIPEFKQYLKRKLLDFKVFLIIGNAPGHHETLQFSYGHLHLPTSRPRPDSLLQGHEHTALWIWIPMLMWWSFGSPSTLLIASLILHRHWRYWWLKRSLHIDETYVVNVWMILKVSWLLKSETHYSGGLANGVWCLCTHTRGKNWRTEGYQETLTNKVTWTSKIIYIT